jgi:hypothetical protein
MNSTFNTQLVDNTNSITITYTLLTIIECLFSAIGLIFYLSVFLLFHFYYKCPTLIKKDIFTFILLFSLKPILKYYLPFSIITELTIYCIGVISFYFIVTYINRCLTYKKISENPINFELVHKNYIYLIFIVSSFPLVSLFNLSEKYVFSLNVINIILVILLYRYVNERFLLLLDYLKEKKVTNSSIPDIYLPYMKAHYYYNIFSSIHMVFFDSFIIMIFHFSSNIIYILFKLRFLCYVSLLFGKISVFCLVFGCLMFFYSFNKQSFGIGRIEVNDEEVNIAKFTVIDVDIQQDENANLTERKRTKERKLDKEEDNENDENNEKEKENNMKNNEESESLK